MEDLAPATIALLVVGLVVAVGSVILQTFADSYVTGAADCNASSKIACGLDYNTTVNALSGVGNLSAWFSQIGTIIAAAVIIGLVVGAFMVFKPSQGST